MFELDQLQLSVWFQVWRVIIVIGTEPMLEDKFDRELAREHDRERLAEELERRLRDKTDA